MAEHTSREQETVQAGVPRRAEQGPIAVGRQSLDALALQRQAGNRAVRRLLAHGARRPYGKNETNLPDHLKSGVESLSGVSLDDVKVHYNSMQPARVNALTYARGSDIHLAPGQERHLQHEAWHVAQQAQGRVAPTM